MRSIVASAAFMSMTGLALAQTQRTPPSTYRTLPTMQSAFATAPNSPCWSFGRHHHHYSARRWSPYNPTSPCYSGTPYSFYSAFEPFVRSNPETRRYLTGSARLDENEARERIEAKGYLDVIGLAKDAHGIWRGEATMKDGRPVYVVLDLEGNIYSMRIRVEIRILPRPFHGPGP